MVLLAYLLCFFIGYYFLSSISISFSSVQFGSVQNLQTKKKTEFRSLQDFCLMLLSYASGPGLLRDFPRFLDNHRCVAAVVTVQ